MRGGLRTSREELKLTFIEKANKKFSHRFNYTLVEYINQRTPVRIICTTHWIFEQTPNHHLFTKEGCPRCGHEQSNKKRTKVRTMDQ
jgi:hypothetical protein